MRDRVLVKGVSYDWPVEWVDGNRAPTDFTQGTRIGYIRVQELITGTVTVIVDTGDTDTYVWSDEAGGEGTVIVLSDALASLPAGKYKAEAFWKDTSTNPVTVRVCGEAIYTIKAPMGAYA